MASKFNFIHHWLLLKIFIKYTHFIQFQTVGGGLVAMIGTSMLSTALPYEPGLNMKHLAWIGNHARLSSN